MGNCLVNRVVKVLLYPFLFTFLLEHILFPLYLFHYMVNYGLLCIRF